MRIAFHPGGLRSTTTYLVCLSRSPEYILPCKHTIYNTCVVIFGKPSRLREYHFEVTQCPICKERSDVTVRQLPPTKPPVILTLDSGGVRGLIQLGLLQVLESRIGIPIVSLPDLCIGTSVAQNIFCHSSKTPIPCYIRWFASVFNLTTDSLYNPEGLSKILKVAVNPSRCIFDIATANPMGCWIAIVLPGLCLQDGRVRANNPLAIALRESSIIWPIAKRYNLLLSIRTGFSTSPPSYLTGILDGKQGFLEALNYLPYLSTPDIFQLDQVIDRTLPELDDIYSLEAMSNMDFAVPAKLRVLIEFPGARFKSGQDLDLGSIDLVDLCRFYRYFRKRVDFRVTSLNEIVTIEIANNTFRKRISGFPKSA
ncbi:Acyl transferase/acyl hydrolase/lysophospholipase [Penicillium roqueforti FM164]|uniref:Acyl transferase/acyl hydrolase/lysophospholipase n=1 Tax=Penicillium roqueforti (strain FM164) TaxID=1365484 RepID=W6Q9J7_PENRF|nr:Acyl transferase/acyl hydrolase/lysophospholipase [Penicillium roqueforti FM164]